MNFTPWRSNVISCYFSTDVIGVYRKYVMDIFDGIAYIHGLECIATQDCLLTRGVLDRENPLATAPICDVVYFRSTPRTIIDHQGFEKMIDSVFGKPTDDISKEWFVCPMLQSSLGKYPYPKG